MSDTAAFGYSQLEPSDFASEFNVDEFHIMQLLAKVRTAIIVQVKSCTNSGGLSRFGFVSAQPMVNMIDGIGNKTPHGTIFNLPYFRLQGGTSAIIMDPQVGDIGIALICDRDISSVKATQAVSNPGSNRLHDLADGIYIGGILNGIPTSYIQFDSLGNIVITPKPGGFVNVNGSIHATGAVIAGFGGADQVGLQTHVHEANATNSPTNPPTPGT